jgi:serine protease Do
MRHYYRPWVGFLSGIAGALVVAGLFFLTSSARESEPAIKVETTPVNRDARLGASFAPVVKRAAPSVVNIYSTHIVHIRPMRIPVFVDPVFRQFFGNQFPNDGREHTRREQSLGSGVIISPDGYILTANHVVDGADEIEVAIADNKKEFTARVVGTDPPTDVAVLKIDAKDLPAVALGDSDQLEVGDIVLAIGNPFRVGQTVTMGIVSALGRSGLTGFNQYQNFIQTDAAINPGNSGGALVDAEGRLVGINTAIIPNENGGNQGVGFAVPINMARRVMELLIAGGKVTRGDLPILIQDITPRLAKSLNLPDQKGALVSDIFPNSPAEKAGIKSGDVIIGFNGKDITDVHSFQLAVSECAPGSSAVVKLLRNGSPETVTVMLTELPVEVAPSGNDQKKTASAKPMIDALAGVAVADLEPEVRRQLGMPPGAQGALVSNVEQASNSADAGLQYGDVIMEIDRQPVSNSSDAVKLGRQARGNQILLKIWRRQGDLAGTCYLSVDNTKIGK